MLFDLYCSASLVCHNLNSGFGDKHLPAAVSSKILGQVILLLCVEAVGVAVNVCLGWNVSNTSQADFWIDGVEVSELAVIFDFYSCIVIVKGAILLTCWQNWLQILLKDSKMSFL